MEDKAEETGSALAKLYYVAVGLYLLWTFLYFIGVSTVAPGSTPGFVLAAMWAYAFLLRQIKNMLIELLPVVVVEATKIALVTHLQQLDQGLPVELTEAELEDIQDFVDADPQGNA